MIADSDYIPIAALNHYSYCPHRCWRMFCAGEFTDNQYTIEGTSLHDRVHTQGDRRFRSLSWLPAHRTIWATVAGTGLDGGVSLYLMNETEKYPPLVLK